MKMTDGEKLAVTVDYAFDYTKGHYNHLYQFDVVLQFFEHRLGLKGFVSDDDGDRIEEGSELDSLLNELYEAFDVGKMPEKTKELLLRYEMYEILMEYEAPLSPLAIEYRDELLKAKAP